MLYKAYGMPPSASAGMSLSEPLGCGPALASAWLSAGLVARCPPFLSWAMPRMGGLQGSGGWQPLTESAYFLYNAVFEAGLSRGPSGSPVPKVLATLGVSIAQSRAGVRPRS